MTVDRTHVLATPGMDRHAAYVALSRHRDGVQLHYGRDDFASDAKLAAVLSRERAKDMAADYAAEPDEAVRAFADKREIRLPERMREIVEKVEAKARSMFAGFKPKPQEVAHDVPESTSRPEETKAIQRYARAAVDIASMREKGLPVLPHQKTALARAGEALDKTRHMACTTSHPRSSVIPSLGATPRPATYAAHRAASQRKPAYGPIRRFAPGGSWSAGRRCRLSVARHVRGLRRSKWPSWWMTSGTIHLCGWSWNAPHPSWGFPGTGSRRSSRCSSVR